MANHVFISYAREDEPYTRKLADHLRQRGFDVWMDDRIDFGDRWWQTIVEALQGSASFVVVMAPESERSEWVHREVLLAFRERKPIFPLLLRGRGFSILVDMQYADVTGGRMPPDDFCDRLRQVVPGAEVVRPPITGTTHTLPFDRLSPRDFERLCLWLVEREGFERAEHLGAAGSEQGRDLVAWREGKPWAFQCKRVQRFGPGDAETEVDKILGVPEELRPTALVFLVACDVSDETRRRARARCGDEMACEFWGLTELDGRVKRHPEIMEEFFRVEGGTELPSPDAIARHRAALRERLEAEARARWGGMSVYIQEEGATLPIEASPYQTGRLGPKQNLLDLLRAADRLLILGEPGSGKTVSLERLAWDLCDGPDPVVPVLVRLFHYAGTSLAEWVRATLQETGHLRLDGERALTAFLKGAGRERCFFLFDGLNEVPPPHRDRLVDELARWMAAYPRHPVVLTSRAQDELWRRLRGDVGQAVVVQPIADEEARAYLVAHLGQRGDELYGQLDPRLRAMARTPLILWLIKEAWAAQQPGPGNRGELYDCFVSSILRRDTERRMDADIPELLKRQALADLAYYLGLRRRLFCPRREAVQAVAWRLGEEQAEEVLAACARHGLLAGDDPLCFAPHPTVREYFAALALRDILEHEWCSPWWARLPRSAWRLLSRNRESLAVLAADDWWMETLVQLSGLVPDPDRLVSEISRAEPWMAWWCLQERQDVTEEIRKAVADRSIRRLQSTRVAHRRRAVQALAQMQTGRALQPLLHAAADPDPEVAGLAIQGLLDMGEAARPAVERRLLDADRPLRLGALRYLAERPDDRAVQLLLQAAADPDSQVAMLALQGLLKMGERAAPAAREALRVATAPARIAALRYLVEGPDHPLCQQVPWEDILGQPMVWIPPGHFLMGDNRPSEQRPQHQFTLPGYWIGRYPVTVARFRAFVETTGYNRHDPRSLRGPDQHPVVRVTWHDALAFCHWLSNTSLIHVTLPSEAEWEKAARGTYGRIYPWGDVRPDDTLCNFANTIGHTTPVGQYSPQGDSPYGCADMAGNVWEWTRSLWGTKFKAPDFGYPYDPEDRREDLEVDGLRVLRGGAFNYGAKRVRCAYCYSYFPDACDRYLGFRVMATLVHS